MTQHVLPADSLALRQSRQNQRRRRAPRTPTPPSADSEFDGLYEASLAEDHISGERKLSWRVAIAFIVGASILAWIGIGAAVAHLI